MTSSQKEMFFYPPALLHRNQIWYYNSQTWGEKHADQYIDALYDALENQVNASYHRPFPKPDTVNITNVEVFYIHWKRKQSDARGYSIFYRLLSNESLGVIAIIGDGQDRDNRMREALEKILPHIENNQ